MHIVINYTLLYATKVINLTLRASLKKGSREADEACNCQPLYKLMPFPGMYILQQISACWKNAVLMLFQQMEKERIKNIIKFPYNKYNRYGMVSKEKQVSKVQKVQ